MGRLKALLFKISRKDAKIKTKGAKKSLPHKYRYNISKFDHILIAASSARTIIGNNAFSLSSADIF